MDGAFTPAPARDTRNERPSYTPRKRSLTPPTSGGRLSPLGRAIAVILPWQQKDYPGIRAGSVELMGGGVNPDTVKHWRIGMYPPSRERALRVVAYLRAHAAKALAAASELEASLTRRT